MATNKFYKGNLKKYYDNSDIVPISFYTTLPKEMGTVIMGTKSMKSDHPLPPW